MANFTNNPQMHDQNGDSQVRRWVHQPMEIEHYGTKAKIHQNGKVTITTATPDKDHAGEMVIDEVEVPASLIFKIGMFLKATRKVEYVSVSQPQAEASSKG